MINKAFAEKAGALERFSRKMVEVIGSKPSGVLGRFIYAHPWGHYLGFDLLLKQLSLTREDYYLEVAQGGGEMLRRALKTVSRAAAIDHSPDMVEVAKKKNSAALEEGRLEIIQGDASDLPWPDETFTAVACAEAFFFFTHPDKILKEMYRVLKPGGRTVIGSMTKKDKYPAEFLFSAFYKNMLLYTNEELKAMLEKAGFQDVSVTEPKKYHQVCYGIKAAQ
jgi:SAM-dependent methyltransferase